MTTTQPATTAATPLRYGPALVLAGGGICYALFYEQELGANLAVWALCMAALLRYAQPDYLRTAQGRVLLAGMLLSTAAYALWGNDLARITSLITIMACVGQLQDSRLRSLFLTWVPFATSLLQQPYQWWQHLQQHTLAAYPRLRLLVRYLGLSVLPIAICVVFVALYRAGNPLFDQYTVRSFAWLTDAWTLLWQQVSVLGVLCVLLGMALTSQVVLRTPAISQWLAIDRRASDTLQANLYTHQLGQDSVRREQQAGAILLVLINALLLVVNALDIYWIWFDFHLLPGMNLSQLVHEGTYALIWSILLSMGIMLYLFRGAQHYAAGNRWLRMGCAAWIAQNALLAASVAMRNYHYIHHHGLAYKRIGVLFFLLLTVVGLITLWHKIERARSTWWLLRVNSWAVYTVFVCCSWVNWDGWIARHNLAHWNQQGIDYYFLFSLSDKALPVLEEHREQLAAQPVQHTGKLYLHEMLDSRIARFHERYTSSDWQSLSLADWLAYRQLETQQANKQHK